MFFLFYVVISRIFFYFVLGKCFHVMLQYLVACLFSFFTFFIIFTWLLYFSTVSFQMSLLFNNDIELQSDPPLHPLAPDSGPTPLIPLSPPSAENNGMAVPLNPTSVYSSEKSVLPAATTAGSSILPKPLFMQTSNPPPHTQVSALVDELINFYDF